MSRITKIVISDILRNKTVLAYTLLLSVMSWSVFGIEDTTAKGMLTMLNIILLVVPLVCVLFSTIYLYNSNEFIELLLSQPIRRKQIWFSIFLGLSICFILAFLVGCGIPLMLFAPDFVGLMMTITGCIISLVFVSIAFLAAVLTRDKAKGIGISMILWLYFALLFDGLVLFLLYQFSDYPIENAMIAVTSLSPIDLARILILLNMDVSAMMGYTGALFKEFYGTLHGMFIAFSILLLWICVPYFISVSKFKNKDL